MPNADMSCARVKQYQSSNIGSAERHNERKNETYENMNVIPERIPMNVHFKKCAKSYMETLKEMEEQGKISTRGLRQDATLFDEVILDVNTMYFERNGGYEYAKQFYEEAYNFIEQKFGADYVLSAVMHADEINKAATEKYGKPIYHYHLHAVVMPVVKKEIKWSKRCKDKSLVGTVRETIYQISHSKKWASNIPMRDEEGNIIYRKNGKPKYRPSYSILQDEFFNYMTEHGYNDFKRGELGSTAEHLSCLEYQVQKDRERLNEIQRNIKAVEVKYEPAQNEFKMFNEIDNIGQKSLIGKYTLSKEDYTILTKLAKEGVSSRGEIRKLEENRDYYKKNYSEYERLSRQFEKKYYELLEICRPLFYAKEYQPDLYEYFLMKLRELQELDKAKEREKQQQERKQNRKR